MRSGAGAVGRGAPGGGAPKAGAPARVQRGQPAPELLLAGRVQAALVDPLERQEARPLASPTASTPGRRDRVRLRQPAQPGGLGGVLAGRGVRARLDERAPAAGELQRPRLVDRAARARGAASRRAGGARHRVASAPGTVTSPPRRAPRRAARGTPPRRGRARGRSRWGRRSRGRGRRGRRRRPPRGRTRAAAGSWRAPRRRARRASSSRSLSRSIASTRSKSSKSSAVTWRAAPSTTMPRDRAAATARASGGAPACQPPVPALSIATAARGPRAQQPAHDPLGGRRAADVAHADEEDPHRLQDARSRRRRRMRPWPT